MVAETIEQRIDALTAGQRLQAAREARNIERADVARWLKLDQKFIKAIEEGDAEHLPGPVFIAGYIRSYAKLVNLPPDQLVREFTKSHVDALPKITRLPRPAPGKMGKVSEFLPKRFSIAAESYSANAKKFVMVSGATIFMAVLGLIAVLLGDKETEVVVLEEQAVETVSPSLAPPDALPLDPQGGAAALEPAPAALLEAEESVPERITVPLELKKLERGDPGVVTRLDEAGLSTYDDLPKENIEMHFRANSWVDIRDSTGRRLIQSMGVAGATKEVRGVAPFQVLIGYGPGVEIVYNGQPFDFSQYQGKQAVVRFTLNAAGGKPGDSAQN